MMVLVVASTMQTREQITGFVGVTAMSIAYFEGRPIHPG